MDRPRLPTASQIGGHLAKLSSKLHTLWDGSRCEAGDRGLGGTRVKAVIMAGGFGTRLRPLTNSVPKPMIPMANKPMMEHIVALLRHHGFEDLVNLLYFQPEVIERYFGDGSEVGVKMAYVTAAEDYGTAGAVKNAESYLDDTFLIISGDVLTDFDLAQALKFHKLIPDLDRPSLHIIAEANTLSRAEAHVARYREILEHCMKEAVVEAVG